MKKRKKRKRKRIKRKSVALSHFSDEKRKYYRDNN